MSSSALQRRIGAVTAWAAVAALSTVTISRASRVAAGEPALDATGERRFYAWAYRDPALVPGLEAAGRDLVAGESVLVVCSPQCDTSWLWVMAAYGLPRQIVVGARTAGQAASARHPTRIEWTRRGVRVLPGAGGGGQGGDGGHRIP